jgi:DNA-binding CsgD family transcriptional regulator
MERRRRKQEESPEPRAERFRPTDLEVVRFGPGDGGLEFVVLAFRVPRLALPSRLTPAEREVARLWCEGWLPATIARRRRRSRFTIVNQVRSIYAKLEVNSRADLLHALTTGS